jgi:putative ABC transport system permease protein
MTRPPWLIRALIALAPADVRTSLEDDIAEANARDTHAQPRGRRLVWWLREGSSTAIEVMSMRLRHRHAPVVPATSSISPFELAWRDVHQALRQLRRAPGFTAAAVGTLALGIGANTALFSVVKTVLIEPLPYTDPSRLVMIWSPTDSTAPTWLAAPEIASYAAQSRSLTAVAGYTDGPANFTGGAEPERVRVGVVTANLFDVLGARAEVGRALTTDDERDHPNDVIVLSRDLAIRRFGDVEKAVGQPIQMNGLARQVIGVMPRAFRLPLDYRGEATEAWVPLAFSPGQMSSWGDHSYFGIGRLTPGATPAAASGELAIIGDGWVRDGHQTDRGDNRWHRAAVPIQDFLSGSVRTPLLVLLGAVGVVLLIACANVVNLVLIKSDERRHEVAVRAALGAARGRLVRQALTESLVLAILGAIVGLGVAKGGVIALHALRPAGLPRIDEAGLDATTLGFTALLALLSAGLFGAAPAARFARINLSDVLKDAGRTTTPGRARLFAGRLLVVGQFACSVTLIIGAVLLLRTLTALYHVDLGFDPRGVLTAQVALPPGKYQRPEQMASFFTTLSQRLEALPGVTAAGAIRLLPLTRTIGNWSITIEGQVRQPADNPNGDFQWVTPGYFRAMGTPLVRGRFIDDSDRADAPLVVVINEGMAKRYWPAEDALGKRFHMGTSTQPWLTVVGIVGETHHNGFVEKPRTEMYLPHVQLAPSIGGVPGTMAIVVKSSGDLQALAVSLRRTVRDLDPNLPLSSVKTMEAIAADALSPQRFAAVLLASFAGLALVLAGVGIYGTLSTLVAVRTPEIGVRLALGAGRASIFRLVIGHGLALAAIGMALGLGAASLLTRTLTVLLYGVRPLDPMTFLSAPLALTMAAVAACALPARRAARLDPIDAMRGGSRASRAR